MPASPCSTGRFSRHFLLVILLLLVQNALTAQEWIGLKQDEPSPAEIEILESNSNSISIHFAVNGFFKTSKTAVDGTTSYAISIPGGEPLSQEARPDLQQISTSLIVPNRGRVRMQVESSLYTDFNNIELAPAAALSLFGQVAPPTQKDPGVYNQNRFYPEEIAQVSEPYILRDYRAVHLRVFPFQYNPVTKVLRVYNDISLQVKTNQQEAGENEFRALQENDGSFNLLYRQHFLNYGMSTSGTVQMPEEEMLIVGSSMYEDYLQNFMQWKARMGVQCRFVSVEATGGSEFIKNTIEAKFEQNQFSHLLLLGDVSDLPTFELPYSSDWPYACLRGNDEYPDVFVGRLTGQNPGEIKRQLDKVMSYESAEKSNYYDQAAFIGNENSVQFFQDEKGRFLQQGFRAVRELHDGYQGDWDAAGNATKTQISAAINEGVSWLQINRAAILGDCSSGEFNATDFQNWNNENKWPIIWSSACNMGDFSQENALSETAMTALSSNSKSVGALAVISPSRVLEEEWMTAYFAAVNEVWTISPSPVNRRNLGSAYLLGGLYLLQNYEALAFPLVRSMTVLGDPSLNLRNSQGAKISADYPKKIPAGSVNALLETSNENGFLIISKGTEVIQRVLTKNGQTFIDFSKINEEGNLHLSLLSHNNIPYLGDITILPAFGPYIEFLSMTVAQGDNNGQADFNEELELRFQMENLGANDASSLQLQLESNDPYIDVLQKDLQVASIGSGEEIVVSGTKIKVKGVVPDEHASAFILKIKDREGRSWEMEPKLKLHAPQLEVGAVKINDAEFGNGNGELDPGERVQLELTVKNNGTANSLPCALLLTSRNKQLLVIDREQELGAIAAGLSIKASVEVLVQATAARGTSAELIGEVLTEFYSTHDFLKMKIAAPRESFSTFDFSSFPWQRKGTQYWEIKTDAERGAVCRSGIIGDEQRSVMRLLRNVKEAGEISFWRKVSTEQNYDQLIFKVDGEVLGTWTGVQDWKKVKYSVPAGDHEFVWEYRKDKAKSLNEDAAWIDDITFPISEDDYNSCQAESGKLNLYTGPELGQGEALIVESTDFNQRYNQLYLLTDGTEDYRIIDWTDDGNFFPELGNYEVLAVNMDDDAFLSLEIDYSVFDIQGGCFDIDLSAKNKRAIGVFDPDELKNTPGNLPLELLEINAFGSQDHREVKFLSRGFEKVYYFVYDMTGRTLLRENLLTKRGLNKLSLDVSSLPAGIYFVLIDNGDEQVTGRMVKE